MMILAVIGYSAAVALVSEILAWLLIYRTKSFKSLKINLEKHASKVETAGGTSKNMKKREARLQEWEEEAGKTVAGVNFKTATIVSLHRIHTLVIQYIHHRSQSPLVQMTVAMLASIRLIPSIFGNIPVGRLPFEPPSIVQKLTQRGLENAEPRECSAVRRPPPILLLFL